MTDRGFCGKSRAFCVAAVLIWGVLSHPADAADSDNAPPVMVTPDWQQVIGGFGLEKASAGLMLPDGRFIVAGEMTADEDVVNSDGVVIALAPDGKLLWQRTYGDDAHDTAHGVVAANGNPEEGYFVIGDRTLTGESAGDILWMLRIGPEGELRWRRDLPEESGEYDRYIFNMPQAEDGGFYAVGKARGRDNRLHARGFIVRFNAAGDVLWQRNYGGGEASVLHNIRLLPDGGLLGIGRTNDTIDKHVAAWVIRTGPDGDVLWEKKFGDYIFQQLRSAVPVGDGFVISGDVLPDNDKPQRAWVLRIDAEGRIDDDVVLAGAYDQYCYDITAHESGGYVVLCDLDHRSDDQTDAIMLRSFAADGGLIQTSMISNAGHDTAFRLFAAPGGDIVVLGTTTSRPAESGENPLSEVSEDNDIWVLRISGKKLGF